MTTITAQPTKNLTGPVQLARPAGCGLVCMLSGSQGLPGQVAQSAPDPVLVAAIGLGRFRAGQVWDHKPLIRRFTDNAEWIMIDPDRAVRFDVFSNIHYGFIFAEMEVSQPVAQFGANAGEEWSALQPIFGANDAVDRLAISIGYELHDAVPSDTDALIVYSSATSDALSENFDRLVQLGGACRIGHC